MSTPTDAPTGQQLENAADLYNRIMSSGQPIRILATALANAAAPVSGDARARAREVWRNLICSGPGKHEDIETIAAALTAAVAEERRACVIAALGEDASRTAYGAIAQAYLQGRKDAASDICALAPTGEGGVDG